MIEVTFDYTEVIKWEEDLNELAVIYLPLALKGATTEAALFFEREAKLGAPVDTGRLRASIGHGPEGVWEESAKGAGQGYWIKVGTNVEYAPYMEFGFTMSKGHVAYIKAAGGFRYVHPFRFEGYHFMQKAAKRTEGVIKAMVAKHWDRAVEAAGF